MRMATEVGWWLGRAGGGSPWAWIPLGGRFSLSVDEAPCRVLVVGIGRGRRRRLPGELELWRRARRSEEWGSRGQPEVLEDLPDDLAVRDERDEPALLAAPGTAQYVDLEDALEELGPGGLLPGVVGPQSVGGEGPARIATGRARLRRHD